MSLKKILMMVIIVCAGQVVLAQSQETPAKETTIDPVEQKAIDKKNGQLYLQDMLKSNKGIAGTVRKQLTAVKKGSTQEVKNNKPNLVGPEVKTISYGESTVIIDEKSH